MYLTIPRPIIPCDLVNKAPIPSWTSLLFWGANGLVYNLDLLEKQPDEPVPDCWFKSCLEAQTSVRRFCVQLSRLEYNEKKVILMTVAEEKQEWK